MSQKDPGTIPGVILQEDSSIVVTGTAFNAKGGAIVLTADETPFYLHDIPGWDDDHYGKEVRVSGKLEVIWHEEEDAWNENGEAVQAMIGRQLLIRDPAWELQ